MARDEARVAREHERLGLRADCARCFGLCCVALAFSASADFAIDKPIGAPCPNLDEGFGCTIHDELRPRGFGGCTTYDCFGAGQQVSQRTFGGVSWRPTTAADRSRRTAMFAALPVARQLHELLWYLVDAASRPEAEDLQPRLAAALDEVEALAALPADELLAVDAAAARRRVDELLHATSARVRAGLSGAARSRRGADLLGARLRRADLRGVDLRGSYLIAADLRQADLRRADLIGADLRDADLAGADLTDALFVTQSQVDSARGDGRTRIPASLVRPTRWT